MEQITFSSQFLTQLNRLYIASSLGGSLGLSGHRKTRAKGSSVEFSDFREYMLGDDMRKIDWNAYGRFQKLYVKEFMQEMELPIYIVLDTSESMLFGQPSKELVAQKLVAVLSKIALAGMDHIQLIWQEKEQTIGTAFHGADSFASVLEKLKQIPLGQKINFTDTILGMQNKTAGLIILISDFLEESEYTKAFDFLRYYKHKVVALQILFEEELELQGNGTEELIDSETGEKIRVTHSSYVSKIYKRTLDDYLMKIQTQLEQRQMSYVLIQTNHSFEKIVFEQLCRHGLLGMK